MVDDEAKLAAYAQALIEAIAPAVGPWVLDAVAKRSGVQSAVDLDPPLRDAAAQAAQRAEDDIVPRIRVLLEADIDQQSSTPLTELRRIVPYAARVLHSHGVPPVPRDPHAEALHPDDIYDLTPGGFNDFGDAVQAAGIHWGAAKAHIHLARRKK